MKTVIILISLFYFFQQSCGNRGEIDYYWRDYNGTIPKDAVPGGVDSDDKTIYIGQGFVNNLGIIPGTLYPGKKSMKVASREFAKIPNFVKILCSSHLHAFRWVSATQKNLHTEMIGKFPVPGGFQDGDVLYIGRTSKGGSLKIGKVLTEGHSRDGKSPMFFVYNGEKYKRDWYQVLTYVNNCSGI